MSAHCVSRNRQYGGRAFNKGTIYLAHVRLLLWVGAVPFAGLLFFGDIVVPMVFGATWAGSGLIAQILATLFFVDGQVWLTESALIASGRPNDLLMLRLLATLISAPLIIVFGMIGTKYIALALSLRAAFLLPLSTRATQFLTGLSVYQTMKIGFSPFLVAMLSACLARVIFDFSRALGAENILALGAGVVVGAPVFFGLFLRFGRPELSSILVWGRSQ